MEYEQIEEIKMRYPYVIMLKYAYKAGKSFIVDMFADPVVKNATSYVAGLEAIFSESASDVVDVQQYLKKHYNCDYHSQTPGISYLGFHTKEDYLYFVISLD